MARRHCAQSALATRRRAGRTSAAGPGFLLQLLLGPGRRRGRVCFWGLGPTLGHCHSDQLIDHAWRPAPTAGNVWQRVSESRSRPALVRQPPLSGTGIAGFPAPSPRIVQPGDQVSEHAHAHDFIFSRDVRIFEMDALAHTPLARKPITLSAFSRRRMVAGLRLTDAGRRETRGPCGVGLPPSLSPSRGSRGDPFSLGGLPVRDSQTPLKVALTLEPESALRAVQGR
jgi:hypothetical protein